MTSRTRSSHWLTTRALALGLAVLLGAAGFVALLLPGVAATVWMTGRIERRLDRLEREIDLTFPRFPERSTIFARDGRRLATLFLEENRKVVRLRRVNELARKAVLAIEDADFYEHDGIDRRAVVRALVANVAEGRIEQGASTITQQLARNAIAGVGEQDSLARKLREAHTAVRLEEEYSKDQILELYLNEVYFGGGAYGIGTAAQRYFGVSPKKLRLPQAALLAGVIAAPSRFSPYVDEDAARARRNVVLNRMASLGWITEKRAQKAKGAPLGHRKGRPFALRQPRAPFFVEYIKRRIVEDERFGDTKRARRRLLYQGGLRIHTTLDLSMQRAARRAARRHLPRPNDPEAAVVSVNPRNGAIVTLVGGKDFDRQKFDLATQGRRQAGSAFKPFTLVAALERGISSTRTYDGSSPTRIRLPNGKVWRVHNAGDASYGRIDLREATRSSVNTVFAQLIMDVGPERVGRVARKMGIESRLPAVPSLALGTASVAPLEMASAFGTLARGGVRCEPFAIRRVTDRSGEDLFRESRGECERVVRRPIAARVVSMLRRVVEEGTGTAARLARHRVFGKTGTTDDFADAWFVGCTRQLCTSTWVGHVAGRIPMEDVHGITVYGGTFPARIWHDFMQAAMSGRPARTFPDPPPLVHDRDDDGDQTEDDEGRRQRPRRDADAPEEASDDGEQGDDAPSPEPQDDERPSPEPAPPVPVPERDNVIEPSPEPSEEPSPKPSEEPSPEPSEEPSPKPEPSGEPSKPTPSSSPKHGG